MKVLNFGKLYFPDTGGVQYYIYDITESLNRKGVHVDVLCANRGFKTIKESFNNPKYTVTRVGSICNLASTQISPMMPWHLKKIYKNYDIIVIHLQDPMANLAYFLARPKCKLIIMWHHDIIKQKKLLKLYKPLLNWLLKRCDKIIINSKQFADNSPFLNNYLNKTEIFPLGINPERLGDKPVSNKGLLDFISGKKVVFSLGRLVYYKAFHNLIEALEYLPEDYVVVLGGSGPLREELANRAKIAGVSHRVYFAGHIPDEELGGYYKMSDLFVLPSTERTEAFGLVQAESMFFSKPVIATDIPGSGVPTVQKDGVSGIIVPINDPKAIANAVIHIREDELRYSQYSKNAKDRFDKLFHIDMVAKKYIDIFNGFKS